MKFLKSLFGGGSDDSGLYIYVRPKMCEEIVRVRVDLRNHLSTADEGDGYFTRKMVSATRCPFQAEVELHFDKNRRLTSQSCSDGEIVTKAEYDAWVAEKQGTGSAGMG